MDGNYHILDIFSNACEFQNQIHGLGLKYGIYEDYGNYTCGGYPGVYGNEELDAQTIADWGADYIKLDGCYMDPKKMDEGIYH